MDEIEMLLAEVQTLSRLVKEREEQARQDTGGIDDSFRSLVDQEEKLASDLLASGRVLPRQFWVGHRSLLGRFHFWHATKGLMDKDAGAIADALVGIGVLKRRPDLIEIAFQS